MNREANKSYKITIEETKEELSLISQQWMKGGTENKSEDGEYGYTPQIETIEKVKRIIYTQVAEEKMDLIEVIKALNGIK